MQVAHPVWLAHQPRRFPNRIECPGTHCSLIEQEREKTVPARSATEFEIKDGGEDSVARTERESDNMRRETADLLVLPRPAKSMQNGTGFSGKT